MNKKSGLLIAASFVVGLGIGYLATIEYAKNEYAEMMRVYNSSEASSRLKILSKIRSDDTASAIKWLESSLDMDLIGLYAFGESSDQQIQMQIDQVWEEASQYRCKYPRNSSNSAMPKELETALAENLHSDCK